MYRNLSAEHLLSTALIPHQASGYSPHLGSRLSPGISTYLKPAPADPHLSARYRGRSLLGSHRDCPARWRSPEPGCVAASGRSDLAACKRATWPTAMGSRLGAVTRLSARTYLWQAELQRTRVRNV